MWKKKIIGTALGGILAMKDGIFNGLFGGGPSRDSSELPHGELYNERKEQADYIELTKQYYEGQLAGQKDLSEKFFGLYKFNVDNSFALYKGQRDNKDELISKINEVDKKVDMMAAIRPYQDALINCKIDKVADWGAFNLARRTCRMIEGEVVLPSTPTVTGFQSASGCNCNATPATNG